MNTRRPSDAVGPRWRKWDAPLPPLDPDPLHVEAAYQAGWDDGFERGIAGSLPPLRFIALAAATGLLLGIILAVSAMERLS